MIDLSFLSTGRARYVVKEAYKDFLAKGVLGTGEIVSVERNDNYIGYTFENGTCFRLYRDAYDVAMKSGKSWLWKDGGFS